MRISDWSSDVCSSDLPARYLTTAPSTVPLDDAAGIPTAAGTAWQALFESVSLTGGQSVLIHAGAGGVGSFAIQFARDAGARVSATASGDGEIGRASCRERVCQYVLISVVAVSLKK